MQDTELNTLYKRLQEEISNDNLEKIVQTCDKILNIKSDEKDILFIRALAYLKGDKPQQAQVYFVDKPSNKDKAQFFSYLYYLYKIGKFTEALDIIEKEADKKDQQIQLLKAQILYQNKQFDQSSKQYLNLLDQTNSKDADYEDIITNCLCVQTHRTFLGAEGSQELKVLTNLLEGDVSRESLFNYGVLLSLIGQKDKAGEILSKFENLIKQSDNLSDIDREDLVMAQIQRDFNNFSTFDYKNESIEAKLKFYEELNEKHNRENNLKAVINNNIVTFRGLYKHQQYGDSVKLIEEAINKNLKQTEEQLLNFKINKLLLVLNKNKLIESTNIMKDIEKNYDQENLLKVYRYITLKSYLLLKMERVDELDEFIQQLSQYSKKISDNNYRLMIFLLQSEICRQRNQKSRIIDLFLQLHQVDKSVYENEIICQFIFSILQSDPALQEKSGPIYKEIAQNTQSLQILEILGDIYNKENQTDIARGIYEKILSQAPESKKYRLKLAQFYGVTDPQRANQLLSQFEDDLELLPADKIEQLESEIALSKMTQNQRQQQGSQQNVQSSEQLKEKKKKKRKIRYPKNFDPENPGPKPDPERWLPKWERKEFRKKKGISGKRNATQGSSSAQNDKETKGTFANPTSTANQDVSQGGNTAGGGGGKSKNKRRGKK